MTESALAPFSKMTESALAPNSGSPIISKGLNFRSFYEGSSEIGKLNAISMFFL